MDKAYLILMKYEDSEGLPAWKNVGVSLDPAIANRIAVEFNKHNERMTKIAERYYEYYESVMSEAFDEIQSKYEKPIRIPRWEAGLGENDITKEMREEREEITKRNDVISKRNDVVHQKCMKVVREKLKEFAKSIGTTPEEIEQGDWGVHKVQEIPLYA